MRPLVEVSLVPESAGDAAKLQLALDKLVAADAALSFRQDAETGELSLAGESETQLTAHVRALLNVYDVKAKAGHLRVAYLETIIRRVETKYTYKKQIGAAGHFAEVTIVFEPTGSHAGVIFQNTMVGQAVPTKFVPVIEKAVRLQAQTGVLAGFPTVDFKFTVIDGKYHDADSSALAFEIAAKACFRALRNTGAVKIIEPIMRVEVVTSREYAPEVAFDLEKRSSSMAAALHGDVVILTASVPLKATLGYAEVLRALSAGEATFSMKYETHREIALLNPPDDQFPSAIAMRA